MRLLRDCPLEAGIVAAVERAATELEGTTTRATKSQVSFRRKRVFAAVWSPRQYLSGDKAPIVLSLYLPHLEASSRWKEVTKVSDHHYTHHLELQSVAEVDAEVHRLLRTAWEAAG